MNPIPLAIKRRFALAAALLWLAALTAPAPADQVEYSSTLPIIISPPGLITVADEDALRAAFDNANAAGQMPRIELDADIELTAPLPPLDNPHAGPAVIDGNNHTLNAKLTGTLLVIGPDTTVSVEQLTLTGGGEYTPEERCGGNVRNEGHLTLRDSLILDGFASFGGGICNTGSLRLEDTDVIGNSARTDGGGIYTTGQAAVSRGRIVDNWAVEGGGVYAIDDSGPASLMVEAAVISGNRSMSNGAGIYAKTSQDNQEIRLAVTDTTLSRNRAIDGEGGAFFIHAAGGSIYTEINRCTISLNSAGGAAGLYNVGQEAGFDSGIPSGYAWTTIRNSTFSGNYAAGDGGAITNLSWDGFRPEQRQLTAGRDPAQPQPPPLGWGSIKLYNSTITENWAGRGSGIFNANAGWFEMFGTIVAGNAPAGRDCWFPVGSEGYSLDSDNSCGLGEPNDLPGGVADLEPLAVYPPGRTATHALGPASQARDRIPAGEIGCDPAGDTDQRGVSRPQPAGGLCDVGAFEAIAP